jgi:hypothetical protein
MSSAAGLALLQESPSRLFALCIFPFPRLPIPQSGTPRRLADMAVYLFILNRSNLCGMASLALRLRSLWRDKTTKWTNKQNRDDTMPVFSGAMSIPKKWRAPSRVRTPHFCMRAKLCLSQ